MDIEYLKKFGINGPKEGKFAIVLGSKWCKSCEFLSKILENFRDNGLLKLEEIIIDENCNLARELNIYAVPALIFFKDGMLLNKNIKVNEEILVKKGVMIGAFSELILKEILRQM